tara:strand:- start:37141 stop:37875 length:735 start_codon:yes stop_codon:yes gene_type:complete
VNYKLEIIYDGTDFFGWQSQKNQRTVQGDIESALKNILKIDSVNVIGSGRTDSGVHANAQIANVFLETRMSSVQIMKALNRKLSNDVFIKDCMLVDEKFNARFSAKKREYLYYITDTYSPINRQYSWNCKWKFDKNKLRECAAMLIGENDFTLFSKASSETKNKICCIYESSWNFESDISIYRISGNRFLQHMVRLLVGTMIEVGRNRLSLIDFQNILKCKDTNTYAVRAPSLGLFLNRIHYDL